MSDEYKLKIFSQRVNTKMIGKHEMRAFESIRQIEETTPNSKYYCQYHLFIVDSFILTCIAAKLYCSMIANAAYVVHTSCDNIQFTILLPSNCQSINEM